MSGQATLKGGTRSKIFSILGEFFCKNDRIYLLSYKHVNKICKIIPKLNAHDSSSTLKHRSRYLRNNAYLLL